MQEREAVGIFVGLQGGLMHEAANREVGHQQAIELLPDQFGSFATQDDLGGPQVGLQLIQGRASGTRGVMQLSLELETTGTID